MRNIILADDVAKALYDAIAASSAATQQASTQSADPGRTVLGVFIEPFKDWGAPGTVHLPMTGHVLDLPHANPWEGLVSYAQRVSRQCHSANPNLAFALMNGAKNPDGTDLTQDQSTWPAAVDFFYNRNSYLTAEQVAKEKGGELQWFNLPSDFDTPQKQQLWQDAHPGMSYIDWVQAGKP